MCRAFLVSTLRPTFLVSLRPHSPKLNWSECGWEEREEGWGMSFRPAHSARPHGWLLATTDTVYDWLSKPRQFRELMYAL